MVCRAGCWLAALTIGCGAGSTGASGTGGAAGTGVGGAAASTGGGGTGTGGSAAPAFAVVFTPPSQTFQGELQVSLTTAATGYEIRYTTNGQPPSASSTLYTGTPIPVTATTQIRVQLFSAGAPVADSSTGLYIARSFDMAVDLPIVLIDAYGHGALSMMDRSDVDAAFMTFEPTAGVASLSALPSAATRAAFHIRGQSSATFPKTPYKVELRDGADNDENYPLLGLPTESDWALHGPYPDKTLIRNAFVYGLGRDMGMKAPRFAFAEFYLNVSARPLAASDYLGVYLLVETIKNQKDRVNLQQLKPADIALPALTGGYIFKFELAASEEPRLVCTGATATCWKDMELVDPSPVAPQQQTYITQYAQSFHDALHAATFADPNTGYAAFSDPASFADQIVIHELTRNMDAYVRSQYFHKDRDGKLIAGPLWDFDLTMDVGGFFENRNTAGWQYEQSAIRNGVNNDWFQKMLTDPAFATRVATRWKQLRAGLLSDAQVDARINALTAGLANAAARNFQRWTILTTARVGPFNTSTQSTWPMQVEGMRTWVKARMAWLDTQWR